MIKKLKDIDIYIALQPENVRAKLEKLRQTIHKAAPDASEVISYQMPAFKFHGMLAYFDGFKNHYSLFVNPKVIEFFRDDLHKYEFSKATIKFPFDKPFPVRLVTKIIKFAAEKNLEKSKLKSKLKSKKANR